MSYKFKVVSNKLRKKNLSTYYLLLTTYYLLLSSCSKVDFFERSVAFKKHAWESNYKPTIQFSIEDTASLYKVYLVLRHTDAYNYNNLWLNIYTKAPGDTTRKQQFDLTLANNNKGWLGTGMDDIFEHRILLQKNTKFHKAGLYNFEVEQIMREDPLKHILNVGLRIEKI